MSIYAFPQAAGVKFRGCNIAPHPSDTNGSVPSAWYTDGYAWGTGASPDRWAQWLKPSIDAAASLGCNVVRLIFDPTLRVGTGRSHLTQNQLAAILDQHLTYCASLGLWVSLAPCHGLALNDENTNYGLTLSNLQTYLTEVVAFCSPYRNLLSIDVICEGDSGGGASFCATNVGAAMTTAKAALTRTIPVTCSFVGPASFPVDATLGTSIISKGADFAEYHLYPLGTYPSGLTLVQATDADPAFYNAGGGASSTTDYPSWIGEAGISLQASGSQPATQYSTFATIGQRVRCQGFINWALASWDVGYPGNPVDWSIVSHTQAGSPTYAFTTPLTGQTTPFQTIPVTSQPYNGAQDGFAVVEVAPTPSSRTATSVVLSWPAAVGGSGTITYTPQYATVDANKFPTQDWQSASSTTNTSATLTGLSNVRYAFRIQASGNAAP